MNQRLYVFLLLAVMWSGCQEGFWKRSSDEVAVVMIEERELDTLWVEAPAKQSADAYPREVYRASAPRAFDLLHTKLNLWQLDWPNQAVLAEATLTLKPYFYTESVLQLDAKGLDIHGVMRIEGQDSIELNYENTGEQLNIGLGRPFGAQDTVTIYVAYTARPADRKTGGSAAIRSDQGLYFINHDGSQAGVPQQIWTQGETESNSCWFPTIDKPNERTTQEIYITVEDRFKTLSNGVLVSSESTAKGYRTDYWRMEQPHAPYLFMLAIGEFAVVQDQWNDVPLAYWVEPEYEADAAAIFAHTGEMLTFFSERLQLPYPWPKYDQVVVRNFVSGAMENTTGVIFGDFVQRHTRELIDNNNDLIVAHEMFHHWFGDYVTCESWSNLALNESFANYSEYLWVEHKYGADAAGYHLHNELEGYLYTPKRNMHDLIHFEYDDKEDMFDRHSYNKGGCILHYLRYLIGDEAFFKSLNLYLTDNAYTAVESHQLRLAVEEVTGLDWNWFFNQWFFSTGHPELAVSTTFDSSAQLLHLTIEQLQDAAAYLPVFDLPLPVDIYAADGSVQRQFLRIEERVQRFSLPATADPQLVILDPDHVLVGTIQQPQRTLAQYAFQYQHATHVMDRYNALLALLQSNDTALRDRILHLAINDPFYAVRALTLRAISREMGDLAQATPLLRDPHAEVQATAWQLFAASTDSSQCALATQLLQAEGHSAAYAVVAAQLTYLSRFSPSSAVAMATTQRSETQPNIVNAVATILANTQDVTHLDYFRGQLPNTLQWDGEDVNFLQQYERLLRLLPTTQLLPHGQALQDVALNAPEKWTRYRAARMVRELAKLSKKDKPTQSALEAMLTRIKQNEPSKEIQTIYESW